MANDPASFELIWLGLSMGSFVGRPVVNPSTEIPPVLLPGLEARFSGALLQLLHKRKGRSGNVLPWG